MGWEAIAPLKRLDPHESSLMQCVTNVLTNAVKFVGPGVVPMIRVTSEQLGQRVRLWFQDNGIGEDLGDPRQEAIEDEELATAV